MSESRPVMTHVCEPHLRHLAMRTGRGNREVQLRQLQKRQLGLSPIILLHSIGPRQ